MSKDDRAYYENNLATESRPNVAGNSSTFFVRQRSYSTSVDKFKDDEANHDAMRPRSASGILERIIDDEFQRSVETNDVNNPKVDKKCEELNKYLKRGSVKFANDLERQNSKSSTVKTRDTLEILIPRYKKKYLRLLNLVEGWKSRRQALIHDLGTFTDKLDRNSWYSTFVRFVSSSIDVSGTVGGLLLRTESETGIASHALKAASFCGLCGLVSTVAEVEQSKKILDEVSHRIEEDYRHLQPIMEWFEQTEELDSIVQELFPHGIDKDIVRQVQEASAEQENHLKVFKAALMSNVRRNTQLLENKDFLHSLQLFANSDVAVYWWNRLVYRNHPIILDLSRIELQIEFGQMQSIIFQCIPALPLEQQRLTSLPVAGRIMLNMLTMYDACVDLRKGAKSKHSDKLRRHLVDLKHQLEVIEDTVHMMRPHSE